ncbi:MAG: SDR family NAD(P)-dependent oxidoreductase [Paludibacteraceae bacterium]
MNKNKPTDNSVSLPSEVSASNAQRGGCGEGQGRASLLITGASSGIGKATAQLFAERGYQVFDLSRRGSIPCDVTDEASVQSAVTEVMRRTDHIDILILNAGFGISGPAECTPIEDIRRQIDVNFTGAVTVVQQVLPYMRQRQRGRIIFTSSVAAILPIPYQSFYSASKAALNAFALALQNEVRDYGICVSVLMPGDVQTGFTAARKKVQLPAADASAIPQHSVSPSSSKGEQEKLYPHAEQAVAAMEHDEEHGLTPQAMARCLYRIATARHPRPQYIGGAEYHLFAFLQWLLPQRLVNYIVGKLYS